MTDRPKVSYLHRQPIPLERMARATKDARAIGNPPVDLNEWLNRGRPTWRDDLADLWADLRDFPHVLTIGICLGCLTTVGLAWIYAQVAL